MSVAEGLPTLLCLHSQSSLWHDLVVVFTSLGQSAQDWQSDQ